MDKFRQYIKQQENEMNVELPSPEVWKKIAGEEKPLKKTFILYVKKYMAAAAIIVVAGIGFLLYIKPGEKTAVTDLTTAGKPALKNQKTNTETITVDTAVTEHNQTIVSADETVKPAQQYTMAVNKQKTTKNKVKEDAESLVDKGYTRLISLQIKKLKSTPVYAEQPGYFNQFALQLKQMDAMEASIKKDIQQFDLNEELLEQLINVYQQKLNLLKGLQQQINKMNNRIKEKGATSGNPKPYFVNL